jgi:hypothetical protein
VGDQYGHALRSDPRKLIEKSSLVPEREGKDDGFAHTDAARALTVCRVGMRSTVALWTSIMMYRTLAAWVPFACG